MPNPDFMLRCLDLALQGRVLVGNGAMVGAVLVRDSQIIAEGYHRAFGQAHAERDLLERYEGRIQPDDVLYVNLEPCCHQGKTPPCTKILIERGVKHVVFGLSDPDVRVAGKGVTELRTAGVDVIGPYLRTTCEYFHRGYISLRTKGRPWITLKKAVTRDGRTAEPDGSMMRITSAQQNAWSHTFLRAHHDAILVGAGTIISDNPSLSIRFDQNVKFSLQSGLNRTSESDKNSINPYRIVLDSHGCIPLTSRVVSDDDASKTIVCVSADCDGQKKDELVKRGVMVLEIPSQQNHFVWSALWTALTTPRQTFNGITSILVEGGGKTWEMFEDAGLVDEDVRLMGA